MHHSDALLAFYDFPAEHWKHLRTTNPIESSFATVRLVRRVRRLSGVAPMITSRHCAASSSRACTWMPSTQK
jgi:transposase-like protein